MPEQQYRGMLVDDLVSYLDYLPTIVSFAGGTSQEGLLGRDLLAVLQGRAIDENALFGNLGQAILVLGQCCQRTDPTDCLSISVTHPC